MMKPVFRDVLLVVFLAAVCCFPVFDSVSFSPDDFRYLSQVQGLVSHGLDVRGLMVITNSWTQMWWYPSDSEIVFFRPTVIVSYVFDYFLWGLDAWGYALTSMVIHLMCSVVVYFVFLRLLGDMRFALIGGLLFAVHPVHGEAVWYLAGRTDSMAALFWLLAFALYQRLELRRLFYPLSLACFFLALLTKESSLTLLLVLPVYDLFFSERESSRLGRLNWGRYLGYFLVLALYYAFRFSVTGEFFASQMVYPYFYTPSRPGFFLHLAVMALMYLFNLAAGFHTKPFYTADQSFIDSLLSTHLVPLVFTALLLCASVILLRNNRRMLFLASFAFIAWLPASIMYTSERFLYLSSVGFIGILVLLYSELELLSFSRARAAAKVLLVLLLVYYSTSLIDENAVFSRHVCPEFVLSRAGQALGQGPLSQKNIYVVNYVDDYTCSVFLEDMIRVRYKDEGLKVRILTASAAREEFPVIEKIGDSAIEISSKPLFRTNRLGFESRPLKTGEVVEMGSFTVEILEASSDGVEKMRFTFNETLQEQVFLALDNEVTGFGRLDFH